jgi:UDP-glucose 4-epimerase
MELRDAFKGQRILITGGTGFIGISIAQRLAADPSAAPAELILLDNRKRNASRFVDFKALGVPVRMIEADINDRPALTNAMKECDSVLHLAAIAGVDSVALKPTVTMEVNTLGTWNIMEAARETRPKRVVCFSTSEVYGPFVYRGDENAMTSQGPVGVFRWCYAVSKLAAEHWAHAYGQDYGLDVVTLRPFNVYGPRQVGEGAVRKFVMAAIKGDDLVIHGDGNQIRSWCYIDDMVEGTLLALAIPDAAGHAFNIGNPRATLTVRGLAERIIDLAGSRSTIVHREALAADVEIRVPSIESARTILGYEPSVMMEEGLKRTVEWYRQHA